MNCIKGFRKRKKLPEESHADNLIEPLLEAVIEGVFLQLGSVLSELRDTRLIGEFSLDRVDCDPGEEGDIARTIARWNLKFGDNKVVIDLCYYPDETEKENRFLLFYTIVSPEVKPFLYQSKVGLLAVSRTTRQIARAITA